MSSQSTIEKIQEVLSTLRPMILNDGGNIEFIKYENNIVYVKLLGACVHCPASMFTLKLGVEEALKAEIPEISEVIAADD